MYRLVIRSDQRRRLSPIEVVRSCLCIVRSGAVIKQGKSTEKFFCANHFCLCPRHSITVLEAHTKQWHNNPHYIGRVFDGSSGRGGLCHHSCMQEVMPLQKIKNHLISTQNEETIWSNLRQKKMGRTGSLIHANCASPKQAVNHWPVHIRRIEERERECEEIYGLNLACAHCHGKLWTINRKKRREK